MIPHGNSIKIFTGNSNPKLASDICTMVGVPLGDASLKRRLRILKNHIGNIKRFDQYNKVPEG